jgi:transposase
MAKVYRPYFPEQDFLLPPSLREWLSEDHLAYFVSDLIDQLDLSLIERHYEREDGGYPPYHPRMMTKVLVYGYCVGVFSSRRIEKRLAEDVAFRVLAAVNEPDFRTISEFRRIHLKALEGLFVQVLQLALKLGAMKLGRVAIDGTKMRAAASKRCGLSLVELAQNHGPPQHVSRIKSLHQHPGDLLTVPFYSNGHAPDGKSSWLQDAPTQDPEQVTHLVHIHQVRDRVNHLHVVDRFSQATDISLPVTDQDRGLPGRTTLTSDRFWFCTGY